MLTGTETRISTQYHQVRASGDIAAIMGVCKAIFALDDAAKSTGAPRVLDVDFIAEHTHGFEAFEAAARAADWDRDRAGVWSAARGAGGLGPGLCRGRMP